jgi:hypothetical protein
MSTVEDVNPQNIGMPGIDKISQCVEELLLQLRQADEGRQGAQILGHS